MLDSVERVENVEPLPDPAEQFAKLRSKLKPEIEAALTGEAKQARDEAAARSLSGWW